MTPHPKRHRIIEFRGDNADGWLKELDKFRGDPEAFTRYVVVDNKAFYQTAPEPRKTIMIPRESLTHEVSIDARRFALTVCSRPKFILLEELR